MKEAMNEVLTDHLKGYSNVICDEVSSLTYADISDKMRELDNTLGHITENNCVCIAVVMQNTVAHVIALLYLLSNKVNVFICSSNLGNGASIPTFCNKVLVNCAGLKTTIADRFVVEENPAYVANPASALKPKAGAVLFASSGTTGPAKYIHFDSARLIDNARKCAERFRLGANSRILVPVPVSHMYGMGVGLLPALLSGAALCLVDKNNILKLFDKLHEFKPDVTLITPAVAKMILLLDKRIPGHSIYISAGERLDQATRRRFCARYGHLINLYGSSELGAVATSAPDGEIADQEVLTALTGVEVIIDGLEKGEILCKHDSGFRQYIDKSGGAITPRQEWHRTRDLGVYCNNGFTVLGRTDNCINRSGYLISLEEIEHNLQNIFEEIERVVVLEIPDDEKMITRLVAVIQLTDDSQLDVVTLTSVTRQRINRYSQPDEFYIVASIPRLANGKPDRISLINNYKNNKN